jgi:biopolymer transport protein TolR
VTLSNLAEKVQQAQNKSSTGAEVSNTAVVISADKSVKYESVVKVMDTLQRAGIARVGLSVQLVN